MSYERHHYPDSFKRQVMDCYYQNRERGWTATKVAKKYKMSPGTLTSWLRESQMQPKQASPLEIKSVGVVKRESVESLLTQIVFQLKRSNDYYAQDLELSRELLK